MGKPKTAKEALDQLGAKWSPDFDAYASGQIPASQVRCVLCTHAPCDCPGFGTPAYFALLDKRHGTGA
jgi:predicted dienelactone hydrolase